MKAFLLRLARYVCLPALFTLLLPPMHAQTDVAQLTGLVTDSSGAVLPRASVLIVNQDTGVSRATHSDQSGEYVASALQPGRYRVTIEAPGFKTLVSDNITLNVSQRANINFQLQVGGSDQTVTVDGGGQQINTTDASVNTTVDRQFVENIPLNGRSFQSLITLTPGVVTTPTGNGNDQGQFSVAGQRAGSNNFTLDGVSVNFSASIGLNLAQTNNGGIPAFSALGSTSSLVSVDALQEFQLASSTYSPEYGRQSGAQINLATRSGTNQFHGAVFDYLRNDAFDASDWFADETGQPKPRERQNDFGGVVGGPIFKDKTFFFASYEGLRVTQPLFEVGDVPSLAARAIASGSTKAVVDIFPLPNGPATGPDLSQLATSVPNHSTLDAGSLRVDQALNSKVHLFGRYDQSPSSVTRSYTGWAASSPRLMTQNVYTGTLGLTAALTPTITDDFRFNYSRSKAGEVCKLDDFGGAIPPPDSALTPSWQDLSTSWVFLYVGGGRSPDICTGRIGDNLNHQLNLTDSAVVVKNTHLLKFGFDFRMVTPTQNPSTALGGYDWFATPSLVNNASPDESEMVIDPSTIKQRYLNFSSFVQDTWKVSPRLTMTYGIRWDMNPPPTETNGAANAPYVLSEDTNVDTATLLPRGTPLWHTDWKNFAPRLGISYVAHQDAERPTVVRLGFGQFYDLGTSTAGLLDNSEGWFPYSLLTELCNLGVGPSCQGFPYTGPKPAFVFSQPYAGVMAAFNRNLKLPYSLEWSAAVEQGLSPHETITITYLGSVGRRLIRQDFVETANPIISSTEITKNNGYSNYNALQVQYQRRLARGLQALASYSWSHSLDINSSDAGFLNGAGIPTSLYKLSQDYGNSDFDIRSTFSAALTYNIPSIASRNKLACAIVCDWAVESNNIARTGVPFNVTYISSTPGSFQYNGTGFSLRPDQVPGQPIWLHSAGLPGGKQLNLAAFSIPGVVAQGNESRNNIFGFSLVQMDIGLRRQFNLTERINAQFRAEGFNIINHPNFSTPSSAIGTCSPGVTCTPSVGWGISQTMLNQGLGSSNYYGNSFSSLYQVGGPRSLQLSMKLQF